MITIENGRAAEGEDGMYGENSKGKNWVKSSTWWWMSSYDHTPWKAPDPVRSLKLSQGWLGKYCGRGLHGNSKCCSFCQISTFFLQFLNVIHHAFLLLSSLTHTYTHTLSLFVCAHTSLYLSSLLLISKKNLYTFTVVAQISPASVTHHLPSVIWLAFTFS